MEKEDIILQKRLSELARRSYEQNMFTFTDFLALPELDLFYKMEEQLRYAGVTVFGGTADCDRKIVRFGNPNDLGYEEPFPICCIAIEPLFEKFGEALGHRDYLGAFMNLGMERENLGDIFIQGKTGYVFCLERMASFILENITQVRHTQVRAKIVDHPQDLIKREVKHEAFTTSSERIDGIIAKTYHLSRNQSLEMFRAKKIFVNSRLCENNSYQLKVGDIVSARGFGKFDYEGVQYETKKGKLSVQVGIYQ